MASHRRAPARSLDSLEPGEHVWVAGIIGRETERRCSDLDLLEGDRVVCLRITPDEVVLGQSYGAVVHLDRKLARRIEVVADDSTRSEGGAGSVSGAGTSTGPAPLATDYNPDQRRPGTAI